MYVNPPEEMASDEILWQEGDFFYKWFNHHQIMRKSKIHERKWSVITF